MFTSVSAKPFSFNVHRIGNFPRATLRLQEPPMNSLFYHSPARIIPTTVFLCIALARPAASQQAQRSTAAELSKKETVASAFLRGMQSQEYEVRSAAEVMPEELFGYRPAEGKFKDQKPDFGPAE